MPITFPPAPLIALILAGGVLAACDSPEMQASLNDPVGFVCRERAAALMSVSFEETSAQPINIDAFGTANYNATAGGVTFRCVADEETKEITSFSRL